MFRLKLILINNDDSPISLEDRRQNSIPENFQVPDDEYLVRFMDSPVIPNPGLHMWLGCDFFANKVIAVIQVPDEHLPYWEVHFHISAELEMIIAYGNSHGMNTGYPGFALDDGTIPFQLE